MAAKKSAKNTPVKLRLRDLARFAPCEGGLEQAKAVLGSEPVLDGNIATVAAQHGIQVPWIGKALSEGTNHRIGIKLARKAIMCLNSMTTKKVEANALEQVTKMLRKTTITQAMIADIRLKLHVAFRITNPSPIIRTGYEALKAALAYMEGSERLDDSMVKMAIDCVDRLAEIEAHMIAQKVKVPLYQMFVEGIADEKRERILRRSMRKTAPKARTTVKNAGKGCQTKPKARARKKTTSKKK